MLPRLLRLVALFLIVSAALSHAVEALEDFGFLRSRLCLNGVWQFQPAAGPDVAAPDGADWGSIRVPGTWVSRPNFPGILSRGKGTVWKSAEKTEPAVAWYQREIRVPGDWNGRTILLSLKRVSTDAVVFVDGTRCGEINWPSGDVDLTKWLKPGAKATLRLLVTASPNAGKVLNAMGVGQNTQTTYTDTSLTNGTTYHYVVSASNAAGESANSSQVSAMPSSGGGGSQLTGTVIGTAGSYANSQWTVDKVFDGNLTTFFDAPTASGAWAGLDLGTANVISQIRFCPRSGQAGRMTGGVFQGSNSSDFSGAVTLFTVSGTPTDGVMTIQNISNSTPFRYVRYLSPTNGWCNIAEVSFW